MPNTGREYILFTVDVEDWFQVENFKGAIPSTCWPDCELRVERNTHQLLDLLDALDAGHDSTVRATFFVLGWIAERLPALVREIQQRGHEVASHGYGHALCHGQEKCDLAEDLCMSKKILEDIIGTPVFGYRAPSFSISPQVLETIRECGYLYDSSFNSFQFNSRYGHIPLTHSSREGLAYRMTDDFYEIPISNLELWGRQIPLGGGGYFRLVPFPLFHLGIRSLLQRDKGYMFYLHPWELDPGQPRVKDVSALFRFRHYVNLSRTKAKVQAFLNTCKSQQFVTCSEYLGRHDC
ncbi:XrtA system polysaccharide deacetylase [Desulfuromonas sp. AOP6]|uniref:XrtA system polysaccharide deacetylase n=1 Tax=Desulfuromonas sp. AOP6 TaxID=1566351 RepID=UPI00128918F2|nr:XrtA system polysaccharide deacetylase [Desulfuromonas sp. AOP6]BCA79483.1 polysaccharide deacetylase [Desulfuromonas sp. AOP6]